MAHEVETRDIEPQATAGIRATTTPEELGRVLGEILPEVWGYLRDQGTQPAGPPFARYHEYRQDRVELEAGLPVAEPVTGEGRISAGTLPGGKVAATWHVGPYDTLSTAYEALEAWIGDQDRKPVGAPWEVYWTDPGETSDSSEWKTEVLWPIG